MRMSFAWVYCMLAQQPRSFGDLIGLQRMVFGGRRDQCNVVLELTCRGSRFKLTQGGIEADEQVVREGYISHMRIGGEIRWCVPEDILNLEGVWSCNSSFMNIFDIDLFGLGCGLIVMMR